MINSYASDPHVRRQSNKAPDYNKKKKRSNMCISRLIITIIKCLTRKWQKRQRKFQAPKTMQNTTRQDKKRYQTNKQTNKRIKGNGRRSFRHRNQNVWTSWDELVCGRRFDSGATAFAENGNRLMVDARRLNWKVVVNCDSHLEGSLVVLATRTS